MLGNLKPRHHELGCGVYDGTGKRNRQHVSDFQDVRMLFHKVTPGLGLLKDRLIVQLQSCMLDVKDSEENASYATILRRVPPGQSQEAV